MPVMNGIDAAKKIREIHPSPTLPITAVSERPFSEIGQECINVDMGDYLEKPYNLDVLYKKIMELTVKFKGYHVSIS